EKRESKPDQQCARYRDDDVEHRLQRRIPEAVVGEGASVVVETDEQLARLQVGRVSTVQAVPEQRGYRIDDDDQQKQRRRQEQQKAERALGEVLVRGCRSVGHQRISPILVLPSWGGLC